MVEKPFGSDLHSARELNETMHAVFPEEAICRVRIDASAAGAAASSSTSTDRSARR